MCFIFYAATIKCLTKRAKILRDDNATRRFIDERHSSLIVNSVQTHIISPLNVPDQPV